MLLAVLASAHEKKQDETPVKYMLFREDCFDAFFVRFDFFSDMTCHMFSFSKLVGYAIITGSIIFKLPQIMIILYA